MDLNELNLNVTGDVKSPIEVVIREGVAIQLHQPKKFNIKGTIYAALLYVIQYYNLQGGTVKTDKAIAGTEEHLSAGQLEVIKGDVLPGVVIYNYGNKNGVPSIHFNEYPANDEKGATVYGDLVFNEHLAELKINETANFTSKALVNLLTKHSGMFKNATDCRKLIGDLKNMEVKFTDTVKKANDNRGNVEDSIKQEIVWAAGQLPEKLTLSVPIFYGTPKINLDLEIQIDKMGTQAVYSFYCMELESTKAATSKAIIDSQVEDLKELFVCVEQI